MNLRARFCLVFILCILTLLSLTDRTFCLKSQVNLAKSNQESFSTAEVKQNDRHLLLITIPGFTFSDVDQVIKRLPPSLRRFSLGGMTLRTARGTNRIHNLATLATGRWIQLPYGWNGYNVTEPIQENDWVGGEPDFDRYGQQSGRSSETEIVHPAFFSFVNSSGQTGGLAPGWFGSMLEEEGVATYVFGNSDTLSRKQRFSSVIVMNREGESKGVVDARMLTSAPRFPTGKITDFNRLQTSIERVIATHSRSLVVAEIGDVERIHAQLTDRAGENKQEVWDELYTSLGAFLQHITAWQQLALEKNERLDVWLLAPFVSKEAQRRGELLAPLMVWNGESGGVITSPTTRQTGIVANIDVVPSLLTYFQLPVPEELAGQAFEVERPTTLMDHQHEQVQLASWNGYLNLLFTIYQQRRPVITSYLLVVMMLLITLTISWWFRREIYGEILIRMVVSTILFTPVYFLWLTPLISYVNAPLWTALLFLLSSLTSVIVYLFFRPYLIGIVSWVTSLVLLIDLALGSVWMKRSFLGFDPIIAARFYGIGNEYAGILIGASVLALTAGKQILGSSHFTEQTESKKHQLYKLFAIGWFAFNVYMLGGPGVNFGATVAGFLTFMAAYCLLFQVKLRLKSALMLVAAALCVTIGFILLYVNQEHTHIGAALQLLLSGNIEPLAEIVQRKWELNIRLIRVSLWGKLFVLCFVVLLLILFRREKEVQNVPRRKTQAKAIWYDGLRSIVIGSVFLLLLNDSGIVAAATAMIFVTFPLIYLQTDDIGREGLQPPDRS